MPPPRSTLPPHPSTPIFTDPRGSSTKGLPTIKRAVNWIEKKMSVMSGQPSSLSSDTLQAAVNVPLPPNNTTSPNAIDVSKNSSGSPRNEDLLNPPYAINNAAGALSSRTLSVSRLR